MRFDLSDDERSLLGPLMPKSRKSARADRSKDHERDLLRAAHRHAMAQSTGALWALHDGVQSVQSLVPPPGTTATLVGTGSGYCWAALTNSSNRNGNGGLDNMMWEMVRSIERWSPGRPPHR